MKKLFILATAAVAFASCSDSDLVGNIASSQSTEQPQAVEFGTYMGTAATRAYEGGYTGGSITNTTTDDGTTALKSVGFGVFAYHSGYQKITPWGNWNATTNSINKEANFMYNEKVTWSTSNPANQWIYSPVKYWPNGTDAANAANSPSNTATESGAQYLSFFAYAPYVALATSGTDITTDLPTTPAAMTAAVPTTENASGYGIVAMSKNTEQSDIQLKYKFGTAADEAHAIDMLWGLRGSKVYSETDGDNNTETTLGSVYNTDLTKQTVDEKVNFLFKHALARVGGSTKSTTAAGSNQICGLKVVVDVDKNSNTPGVGQSNQEAYFGTDFDNTVTLVTIKSVNIRDQYTYSKETGSTINETRSDFNTEGWFDIMKGQWTKSSSNSTTHANGVTYSVTANNEESVDNAAPYALNTDIAEPTTALTKASNVNIETGKWKDLTPTGVNLTAKNVYANENIPGLLLIPGTTGSNTLYVTVDYIVRTVDTKLNNGFTEVEQVITNKVTLNNDVLNPNNYLTLVMHLGLTSVKFEAIVSNWQYKSDSDITEEGEETGGSTENLEYIWLPSNVVSSTSTSLSATSGASYSVTIPAASTTYAINFTHTGTLTANGIYTDAACTQAAAGSTAAIDGTDANKVNVSLSAANNTSKNKVYYVKVTDSTDGESVITITQKAAALNITASYEPVLSEGKITNGATTITLDINDASGADLDLTNASNTSTINASIGTVTKTATGATIEVPANAGEERTITYSVKVNDSEVKTFSIKQAGA